MKTLFETPSKLVKYALTFVAFFVGLGIILTAFFGFNTSAEFGGHYELTIDCMDSAEVDNYYKAAKEVLGEYGYSVSDYQIEDRSYCETLVIRYASSSDTNANLIKADLATKLNLDQSLVQANSLALAYSGFNGWDVVLFSGILLAFAFVIGLVLKGWNYGVGFCVSYAATMLLSLAIIGFTRIVLSPSSLVLVTVISTMSMVAFAYLSHHVYALREDKNDGISFKDAYLEVINIKAKELYIVGGALAVVGIVLMLTFNKTLVLFGLTYLVAMLVLAFISIILVPAIFVLIEDTKLKKLKATLTRNKKQKNV